MNKFENKLHKSTNRVSITHPFVFIGAPAQLTLRSSPPKPLSNHTHLIYENTTTPVEVLWCDGSQGFRQQLVAQPREGWGWRVCSRIVLHGHQVLQPLPGWSSSPPKTQGLLPGITLRWCIPLCSILCVLHLNIGFSVCLWIHFVFEFIGLNYFQSKTFFYLVWFKHLFHLVQFNNMIFMIRFNHKFHFSCYDMRTRFPHGNYTHYFSAGLFDSDFGNGKHSAKQHDTHSGLFDHHSGTSAP